MFTPTRGNPAMNTDTPVIVYVRANRGTWSLTCAGETWLSAHVGLFGAALVRRRFDLPAGYPVEFRLV